MKAIPAENKNDSARNRLLAGLAGLTALLVAGPIVGIGGWRAPGIDGPLRTTATAAADTVVVYPGDTDNSGEVDEFDVLPLGLFWEEAGPARDTVSFAWSALAVEEWPTAAATYADANGDGTVNELDLFAIGFNWGRSRGGGSRPGYSYSDRDGPDRAAALRVVEELRGRIDGSSDRASAVLELAAARLAGPARVRLSVPHPNPFNGTVRLGYNLAAEAEIEIAVYDLRGRLVRRLVRGSGPPGEHEVYWDGRDEGGGDSPSGVYFIRLAAGGAVIIRKALLVR